MTSQIFVYDFTLGKKFASVDEIKEWLNEWCKKWAFQLEIGEEDGYEHYQGRFSLKAKQRLHNVKERMPWNEIHLSPTAKINQGNAFYVTKVDSRKEGPWKDTDPKPLVLPPHLKAITEFNSMQSSILQISEDQKKDVFNRKLNLLYDPDGNHGKSIMVDMICANKKGIKLPPLNNYKDIMQYICSKELSITDPTIIFFDMPRALKKDQMFQMISACETIKDGWAYDTRYGNRDDKFFARPVMWIFSNNLLDFGDMSKDRWLLWTVNGNGELLPYEPPTTNGVDPADVSDVSANHARDLTARLPVDYIQRSAKNVAIDSVLKAMDELYGPPVSEPTFPRNGAEF